MASVIQSGWETGNASEVLLTSGTVSVQGTTTRGAWSAYALRTNPGTITGTGSHVIAGNASSGQTAVSAINVVTIYARFYFRVDTLPSSLNEEFFSFTDNSAGSTKLTLRINSDGTISAYDGTPTLIATGTAVLSTATWYRIEVKGGTSAGAVVEWRVDGSVDVSTTATLSATNYGAIALGKRTNRNSKIIDYYFDDVLVSDSAYPGAGQCGILIPNANGNYTGNWTIGAGAGSSYQNVDEVPHDSDTTYLVSDLNTAHAETEGMQPASTLSISGTINCAKPCIVVKRDGGTNGSIKLRHRSNTTDTDLTGFATTASYTLLAKLLDTDPATSSAWLTGGIDGAEVGALENSAANKSRMTAAYLMVDWTPTAGGSAVPAIAMHYNRTRRQGASR